MRRAAPVFCLIIALFAVVRKIKTGRATLSASDDLADIRTKVQPLQNDFSGGNMANDQRAPGDVSRRSLFKRAGVAGAAAIAGGPLADIAPAAAQSHPPAAASQREALETLTAAEADTLEAICARLIPSDESGPGAAEARAAHYIDRALTGPFRSSRDAYAAGLAALDAYAQTTKGNAFARLSAADQDAVLGDLEKNVATGFVPNAAAFFALVRAHTIQGTFCDPYYGGNAGFVGWDLVGYPGIRTAVDETDQRLKAPASVRKSAYDDAMFTMKGAGHGHRP
jgi:gluconate 2-dehydrogenase gamma chain